MLEVTAMNKEQGENCPIRNVLAPVMGKWSMLILFTLEDGAQRFSGVKRLVGDITQRVLTENLRQLERDGYLTRRVIAGPPIEVHYELTDRGAELLSHLNQLAIWANGVYPGVRKSRSAYDG